MEYAARTRRQAKKAARQQDKARIRKAVALLVSPPSNTFFTPRLGAWHPAMRRGDAVVRPYRHSFVPVAEMPR